MMIWIESGLVNEPIIHGYRKGKAIIFENASMNPYQGRVFIKMDQEMFDSYYKQLFVLANSIWKDLELREVTGFGNDYQEYYDKELDNDGSAAIDVNGIYFYPPAPHLKSNRLYRFTKKKIETYLYDLKKRTSYAAPTDKIINEIMEEKDA